MSSRLLALGGLVVAVIVAVVVISGGADDRHHVWVTLSDASNLVPGQSVRAAGTEVGSVSKVVPSDNGRHARVQLSLDDRAWPLTSASVLNYRFGGTIAYANRYLDLVRGTGGTTIRDGGELASTQVKLPVEYDRLLTTFTPKLRRDLRGFLDHGGNAMKSARSSLRGALRSDRAPAALDQTSALLRDLDLSQTDLRSLITHGDRVVDAVQRANPGIGDLVDGTAGTLSAVADEARNTQLAIERAPATLQSTRSTLTAASTTLSAASQLSDQLAPGVTQLQKVAAPLSGLMTRLATTAPDVTTALSTLRRAAPDIGSLLDSTRTVLPSLSSVSSQATESMQCIRPYSPEIAAFFSNWDGFTTANDGRNKYVRLAIQASIYPTATVGTAKDLVKTLPQLKYAFPRPPGYNGGQPWLLPECGAGKDALDPTKNPLDNLVGSSKGGVATNQPPQEAGSK